jgi:uracil-DNA glycosylase family 4
MPPEGIEDFWAEAEFLGRALIDSLDYYQEDLPIPPPPPPRPAAKRQSGGRPPEREAPARWAPAARDLAHLAELTASCRACPRGRARPGDPVRGRGAERPQLVLVGEDPGLYEGPAAELLAAILGKGLQLVPARFYVTSILKCPPAPGEGPDEKEEALASCLAITLKELALLNPLVVLALGQDAGRGLTGQRGVPLGLMRQRAFRLENPPEAWLRVTFSLEQLLAAPALKLAAWKDDFLKIKKMLDNTT